MQTTGKIATMRGALWLGALSGILTAGCTRPQKETPTAPAASASQAKPAPTAKRDNEELLVTTLPSLPGRAIAEEKSGFYCQFFQYSGTGDYAARFRDALDSIRAEGKKAGANAFVNASVSSESHEIQGSKWHSSFVHICGDFVRLE